MVAVIVGVSETILFIIWQTPVSGSTTVNLERVYTRRAVDKKTDDEGDVLDKNLRPFSPVDEHNHESLRHRTGYTNSN